MSRFTTPIIIILVFILGIIIYNVYFDKDIITTDCPSINVVKEYENYRFGYNKDKSFFLLIDNKCNVIDKSLTEYYFEEYFVGKYVTIINKTPENELENSKDIIDFTIKLLEDPLPNVESELKDKLIKKLNNKSKTIINIHLVLSDYSNLYYTSKDSIGDNLLDKNEIIDIRSNTTLFVFDVLDKSGILDESDILDSLYKENNVWKDIIMWIAGWSKKSTWYKDKKKKYYREAFDEMLFELPINYFYDDMKDKIQTN